MSKLKRPPLTPIPVLQTKYQFVNYYNKTYFVTQYGIGAGIGSELEPLTQLFDNNSSEMQLLFAQLSQLKNHLE